MVHNLEIDIKKYRVEMIHFDSALIKVYIKLFIEGLKTLGGVQLGRGLTGGKGVTGSIGRGQGARRLPGGR